MQRHEIKRSTYLGRAGGHVQSLFMKAPMEPPEKQMLCCWLTDLPGSE